MRSLVPLLLAIVLPLPASLAAATQAEAPYPPRRSAVVRVVEEAGASVVNISTQRTETRSANPFHRMNPMFREFFAPYQQEYTRQSLGSGVIIDPRGYVVTNQHVILPASEIHLTLADGRELEGRLIGASKRFDLAVIRVETDDPLPAVRLGTSSDLMIGETVIAIGNPFGLNSTVTTGVVSALDRTLHVSEDEIYHDFIQIDASINPGNSGGPLLNIRGELIGINTAIYQGAEGIGFAIPVDKTRRILDDLIATGRVAKPWIGTRVQDVTARIARALGVTPGEGVLVASVMEGSPAEKAGLRRGDRVVEVAGVAVSDTAGFYDRVEEFTPGDRIQLEIQRRTESLELAVSASQVPPALARRMARQWLGLQVGKLHERATQGRGRVQGVLIRQVDPDSPAHRAGLQAGDVIAGLNGVRIRSIQEFEEAVIRSAGLREALVDVIRGGYVYHVMLE